MWPWLPRCPWPQGSPRGAPKMSIESPPSPPDAEGDTEVARQTTNGEEGSYGAGWAGDYSLDFGGIIIYPERASERAGDVIPIPMANDVSNCLGLALYGNGNGQTDREQLWTEARKLGTVGGGIF